MNNNPHLPATTRDSGAQAYNAQIFSDMDFPAEPAAIWTHAHSRKADVLTLNRIKHMPERAYKDVEDFRKAFAEDLENYGNT
ncbi:MAG: DUF2795 domain-containing protein [Alphaproteobacteria bacterium]|nr:DUF2795 domain-containing protein [Alphaproteobacteria bacterium]